ncbi:helix-turn-helix domain-containing protein [Streptomyces sp. 6N223]|uniref:helix-turn-helix domain-containing protein n=1 Tax=Streptomyces sp. 6N223 TaxID=3457412 RepID=UPI003FD2D35E
MGETEGATDLDARLAARLAELRAHRAWSLDELAHRSGISRSTLSRLERGQISPTAALLGKLCTVYERTMSRLLAEVEAGAEPPPLVRADAQPVWRDETAGFTRRAVSPPHPALRGDIVEGTLRPGADIAYDQPPVPGLEHHVWVQDGTLEITADATTHHLRPGDTLRFRLRGPSRYRNPGSQPVRYAVFLVLP